MRPVGMPFNVCNESNIGKRVSDLEKPLRRCSTDRWYDLGSQEQIESENDC